MQNVRVGPALGTGEVPLIADLHVEDSDLIDKIDAGVPGKKRWRMLWSGRRRSSRYPLKFLSRRFSISASSQK
jgi:hypothetical protein